MKKVFKKALIVLLIIVTILNFIGFEHVSYATEDTVSQILVGLLGSFVGILTWPFRIIAMAAGKAVEMLTSSVAYMDGATAGNSGSLFSITPYEILFNKVQLLDINFFDFSVAEDSATYKVRTAVAGWFYVMRLLAVSILLLILIYMGIRMAITTIAEEKARYKKMLVDWVTSIALVFFLQFIIMFTVMANTALVNALDSSSLGDEISAAIGDIATKALFFSIESFACTVVYCMLVFQTLGLVISYINRMIKIAFLIIISPLISITYSIDKIGDGKSQALDTWLKEFVYTILMQPFHCIIYMVFINTAFELLVGDGNPGWEHDVASAVIAILCVKFTKDAEKIVRKIFNFKDENNGTSLAAGTGAALLALNHAKSLGKSARKGINFMKENNLVKAVGKDLSRVGSSAKAAAIATFGEKDPDSSFSERYQGAKQASADKKEAKKEAKKQEKESKEAKKTQKYTAKTNSKLQKKLKEIDNSKLNPDQKKKAKERLEKKAREKNEKGNLGKRIVNGVRGAAEKSETLKVLNNVKGSIVPAGLGFAAASMAYGGDSNLFTSFALGTAINNSTNEFMKNSTGTLAKDAAANLSAIGVDKKDAAQATANIRSQGDRGEYDAQKFTDMINEITKLLQSAGINNVKGGDIANQIDAQMQIDPSKLNLDTILQGALKDKMKDINPENMSKIKDQTSSYAQKRGESNVYSTLKTAESFGVSTDTMAKATARRVSTTHTTEVETEEVTTVDSNSQEGSDVKHSEKPTDESIDFSQAEIDRIVASYQLAIEELKNGEKTFEQIIKTEIEDKFSDAKEREREIDRLMKMLTDARKELNPGGGESLMYEQIKQLDNAIDKANKMFPKRGENPENK